VALKAASLAEQTRAQMDASVTAAQAIPAPCDQAIAKGAPGRPAAEKTLANLVGQSKPLVSTALTVGITQLTLVELWALLPRPRGWRWRRTRSRWRWRWRWLWR
jgi:putative iron-regulated protein